MPESEVGLKSGLEWLDFAAILGYLALTFGIAIWFGRRQKDTEDFFVGGRSVPWFAVGLSILATLFSTISYLGGPGEVIKNGLGVYAGYLALPLCAVVIFRYWIPFFMRLRLTSAYEYLELRYNPGTRMLGATLFVLMRLGWMSVVVYAASLALDKIKGPDLEFLPGKDLYWWIGAVGLIAAVYTAVGGIQAMIWTDVLQCILLLLGVVLAISYVAIVDHTGPMDWWRTAANTSGRSNLPPFFVPDITVRVTFVWAAINVFFWQVCTHGSDQVVLQRYFSTPSVSAARRSYCVNLGVDILMAILLSLCGLALLAHYLKHPTQTPEGLPPVKAAEKLFPHFLGNQLPAGFAGLIISAFLCDAIQTLESGVNAITAVATADLIPKLRRFKWLSWSDLAWARVLSVVVALLVTANAYFVANRVEAIGETLVGLSPKFFNMFVGPLAALFIIGMFMPRCTARSALPAMACGLGVSFVWSWWTEIFGTLVPYVLTKLGTSTDQIAWEKFSTECRPTFLLAIAVPVLVTLGMAFILGRLLERNVDHAGRQYTWRAVLSRPETPNPTL